MSQKRTSTDLSMLSHVPLQPQWLVQLPAFASSDARMVRAAIHLLVSAFYQPQCGVMSDDIDALALASHLTREEVLANHKLLIAGWKKGRGTLTFEPMVAMAQRLGREYCDALERLQDGVIVAIAAPDLFNSELLPVQGAALEAVVGGKTQQEARELIDESKVLGKTKVKRPLPDGIGLIAPVVHALNQAGFAPDTHDEIWQMFADYHRSRRELSVDWIAHFRHWLRNQTHYGRLSPQASLTSPLGTTAVSAPRVKFNGAGSFGPARLPVERGQINQMTASSRLNEARETVRAMRAGLKP